MADKKSKVNDQSGSKTAKKSSGRGKQTVPKFPWSLGRRNLYVLIIALVVIIIGYIFLSQGPQDSVASRTIAPVILVIGYMILVPLAIIIRDPSKEK